MDIDSSYTGWDPSLLWSDEDLLGPPPPSLPEHLHDDNRTQQEFGAAFQTAVKAEAQQEPEPGSFEAVLKSKNWAMDHKDAKFHASIAISRADNERHRANYRKDRLRKLRSRHCFNIPAEYSEKLAQKLPVNEATVQLDVHKGSERILAGFHPVDPERLPTPAKTNVTGKWIHVLNGNYKVYPLGYTDEYIGNQAYNEQIDAKVSRAVRDVSATVKVKGEICVSSHDIGGIFKCYHGGWLALVFEGTAREYYYGDCYSEAWSDRQESSQEQPGQRNAGTEEAMLRFATKERGEWFKKESTYDEAFISPAEAELVCVYCGPKVAPEVLDALRLRGIRAEYVHDVPNQGGLKPNRNRRLPHIMVPDSYTSCWEEEALALGYDV